MLKDFWEEFIDEISDFFEDYAEHVFKKRPKHSPKEKTAVVSGALVVVRPAYLFAERIDNILKIVFGVSLCVSAFTATFLGFASLSQLVDVLINSILGRSLMLVIGASYLLTAFWRLLHLGSRK